MKLAILKKMDQELIEIAEGNYDLKYGENYMAAQNLHFALRQAFAGVSVQARVLLMMHAQEKPLERLYDFYVDSGYLEKTAYYREVCEEYVVWLAMQDLNSRIYSKLLMEYGSFLDELKNRIPFDIMLTVREVTFKTGILSYFRYECNLERVKLDALMGMDNIMNRLYEKARKIPVMPVDYYVLHKIVAESIERILDEINAAQEVEDEELEA